MILRIVLGALLLGSAIAAPAAARRREPDIVKEDFERAAATQTAVEELAPSTATFAVSGYWPKGLREISYSVKEDRVP